MNKKTTMQVTYKESEISALHVELKDLQEKFQDFNHNAKAYTPT